jgi:hypothetical protein
MINSNFDYYTPEAYGKHLLYPTYKKTGIRYSLSTDIPKDTYNHIVDSILQSPYPDYCALEKRVEDVRMRLNQYLEQNNF